MVKHYIRTLKPREIDALFWDDNKREYVFPNREVMDAVIENSESRKPAERHRRAEYERCWGN